jgi:hypothetical protein
MLISLVSAMRVQGGAQTIEAVPAERRLLDGIEEPAG